MTTKPSFDVLQVVVDALIERSDVPTLRIVALVCRDLVPRIQRHLFRAVVVRSRDDISSLCELLDKNAGLASLVRSIAIDPIEPSSDRMLQTIPIPLLSRLRTVEELGLRTSGRSARDLTTLVVHPTLLRRIRTFYAHVHTLHIGPIYFLSSAELVRLLCAFPVLRHLHTNDIRFRRLDTITQSLERRMSRNMQVENLKVRLLRRNVSSY